MIVLDLMQKELPPGPARCSVSYDRSLALVVGVCYLRRRAQIHKFTGVPGSRDFNHSWETYRSKSTACLQMNVKNGVQTSVNVLLFVFGTLRTKLEHSTRGLQSNFLNILTKWNVILVRDFENCVFGARVVEVWNTHRRKGVNARLQNASLERHMTHAFSVNGCLKNLGKLLEGEKVVTPCPKLNHSTPYMWRSRTKVAHVVLQKDENLCSCF